MSRYAQGSDGLVLDVAPFIKALEHEGVEVGHLLAGERSEDASARLGRRRGGESDSAIGHREIIVLYFLILVVYQYIYF